jgi:hypothetical protein
MKAVAFGAMAERLAGSRLEACWRFHRFSGHAAQRQASVVLHIQDIQQD